MWVPYFQMADPTVKRKSGFLMPSYSHSNELGTTVQVPYYFALSDHYDFTFAPMVTEKAGTLLLGEWRQRTANGGYSIELAGVWNRATVSTVQRLRNVTDGDFRGSIKTKGRFALDPYYAWVGTFSPRPTRLSAATTISTAGSRPTASRRSISKGCTIGTILDAILQHPEPAVPRRAVLRGHGLSDHRLRLHRQQSDYRRRAKLQLQRHGVSQSGRHRFQSR